MPTVDPDVVICPVNANAIMVGSRFDYWHLLLALFLFLSICCHITFCCNSICKKSNESKGDQWDDNTDRLMVVTGVTSGGVMSGEQNYSSGAFSDSNTVRLPESGSEIFSIQRYRLETPIERLGKRRTGSRSLSEQPQHDL